MPQRSVESLRGIGENNGISKLAKRVDGQNKTKSVGVAMKSRKLMLVEQVSQTRFNVLSSTNCN